MREQTGWWSRRGFLASLAAAGAVQLAAPARGLGGVEPKDDQAGIR